MKSLLLFVCLAFACCTCFVSSASTVIGVRKPYVAVSVPHVPITIPHVAVAAAPYTSVKYAHPRSRIAYTGAHHAYSSYYPTYYSSVRPYSTVYYGWKILHLTKIKTTNVMNNKCKTSDFQSKKRCQWPNSFESTNRADNSHKFASSQRNCNILI